VADLDGRTYEIDLSAPRQLPKRSSPSRTHGNRRRSAVGGDAYEVHDAPRCLLPRVAQSSKFGVDDMDELPVTFSRLLFHL
jgi:hypothetical protein